MSASKNVNVAAWTVSCATAVHCKTFQVMIWYTVSAGRLFDKL